MRILFLVFAMLVVLSCNNNPGSSGYHLSPKVMGQVLLDVNLAEAYSTIVKDSTHRPGIKNADSLSVYYKSIFDHYKITQEQFTESLNWYKNHPDKLDTIYSNIMPKLIVMQNPKPLKGLSK